MSAPALFCVSPGQMHGLLEAKDVSGWLLAVNAMCVSPTCVEQIELISSGFEKFSCSTALLEGLEPMLNLIEQRLLEPKGGFELTRGLLNCFVMYFVESVLEIAPANDSQGNEVVLRFKALVSAQCSHLKSASAYAEQLHVSTEYLNELIKRYTGLSTSQYITSHLILLAKRQLLYTSLSVKEISQQLGFEDSNYFTRLFRRKVGVTPTRFRSTAFEKC